jgi:hypothetical protein
MACFFCLPARDPSRDHDVAQAARLRLSWHRNGQATARPRCSARDSGARRRGARGSGRGARGADSGARNFSSASPCRKRQHVRRLILAPVTAIERAAPRVAHQRDSDFARRAGGRHGRQPGSEPAITDRTAGAVRHHHAQAFTVGIHRMTRRP